MGSEMCIRDRSQDAQPIVFGFEPSRAPVAGGTGHPMVCRCPAASYSVPLSHRSNPDYLSKPRTVSRYRWACLGRWPYPTSRGACQRQRENQQRDACRTGHGRSARHYRQRRLTLRRFRRPVHALPICRHWRIERAPRSALASVSRCRRCQLEALAPLARAQTPGPVATRPTGQDGADQSEPR